MQWLVFVFDFIALTILFRIGFVTVRRQFRPKIAPKPALKVNYWQIARLEIDLLGETKLCDGSPIPVGCKSMAEVHGVDESGHLKDGSCNLNSSLGPVCGMTHSRKRMRASQSKASKINGDYIGYTALAVASIYGDRSYEDNWTDEDGRPW
jgi:hypothetical protein